MPWLLLAIAGVAIVLFGSAKAYGYIQGVATEIDVAGIGSGYLMRRDAAVDFNRMAEAALRDGVQLRVSRAFATMEQQTNLYEMYLDGTGNLAAKPGFSNHQSGIAVDIEVQSSNTSPTYKWLDKHASTYGFVNTGKTFTQKEYWHWEYKG